MTAPMPSPRSLFTPGTTSPDDEQQVRRYSSSIIIEGPKVTRTAARRTVPVPSPDRPELPPEQQKMIRKARDRDAVLEGRRVLVVEDDIRNVYALSNFEPRGVRVEIARNGQEAIDALNASADDPSRAIDLVPMT